MVRLRERSERRMSHPIDEQTSKVSSDTFMWIAGASILGSLALQVMGRKEESTFVGQWAPTILIIGLYSKISNAIEED